MGRGYPLPKPHPLGAFSASILAPAALDLGPRLQILDPPLVIYAPVSTPYLSSPSTDPARSTLRRFFFDDFNDLLERLATYSSPLTIVGDLNIHVDVAAETLRPASFVTSCQVTAYSNTSTSSHQHTAAVTRSICSLLVTVKSSTFYADAVRSFFCGCRCQPSMSTLHIGI